MSKAELQRKRETIAFLKKHCPPPTTVFDLGTPNSVSSIMVNEGYDVINTQGQDLDVDYNFVGDVKSEVATAFEILEHLVSPLNVLSSLNCQKLITTIPLNLWFAKAYRNQKDPWDRHYHEFEDWQFDWLLEKAGWKIIDSHKWISKVKINGIRPFLRNFTPRYYAVYAEKI